ncbi:MAG: hypothetical protein AAFZ65_09020 [Planctomycetota bacterium]
MHRPALSAVLIALAACGGSPTAEQLHTDALDALSRGDYARAVDRLERAVEASSGTDRAPALAFELALARIHIDRFEAQIEFDGIVAEHPTALSGGDYYEFARRMRDSGDSKRALSTVHAAIGRFGLEASPRLAALLTQLEADADSDDELQSMLVGLGYLSQR